MFYNFFLFVLTTVGLTSILVDGKIFDKIRPKFHLFHCYQCLGFSAGVACYTIFYYLAHIKLMQPVYIGWFIFGLIGSISSYIFYSLFDDRGLKIFWPDNKK